MAQLDLCFTLYCSFFLFASIIEYEFCCFFQLAAFAKALESIPRQLAQNAGLDSIDILAQLRKKHAEGTIKKDNSSEYKQPPTNTTKTYHSIH
jgi:hypothetical protein